MYPSLQVMTWKLLAEDVETVDQILEIFVTYALENGVGSTQAEMVADTCVTLACANLHFVSGTLIARLRKVGSLLFY